MNRNILSVLNGVTFHDNECNKLVKYIEKINVEEEKNSIVLTFSDYIFLNEKKKEQIKKNISIFESYKKSNQKLLKNKLKNITAFINMIKEELFKIDAYELTLESFGIKPDDFLSHGLNSCIFSDISKAKVKWKNLLLAIESKNNVYVRTYGDKSKKDVKSVNEWLLKRFYLDVFKIDITIDSTNNKEATSAIREASGYSKKKSSENKYLTNYKVAHIYGKTKNMYAFTAPWNIAYVPNMFDSLTGHEGSGLLQNQFNQKFKDKSKSVFNELIEEFNLEMVNCIENINNWYKNIINNKSEYIEIIDNNDFENTVDVSGKIKIKKTSIERFYNEILKDFSIIEMN